METRISPSRRLAIIKYVIANHYIELTEAEKKSDRIVINKILTTLLYESKRHGWNAAHCVVLRNFVIELDQRFKGKVSLYFENYLSKQEEEHHTFYGSYLSDDSDSEEERDFLTKPDKEKDGVLRDASEYQKRAQIDAITLKARSGDKARGELKTHVEHASAIFDLDARMRIHHGQQVDEMKMKRDLASLNRLLGKGHTLEDAMKELSADAAKRGEQFTSFLVAEYRGVAYQTTKWNKPSRMAHRRDRDEIGKRQYSASVYQAAGVSLFRRYDEAKQKLVQQPSLFDNPAEELKEILLTFREPRPYTYGGYSYSNLAFLLQNIYTQDYDGFHDLIAKDPNLKSMLLNDANPFFSMGDTPYHACKYAYGIKYYKGHKDDRLRPKWRHDGKAERPYSGVVYVSLHPLSDFTSNGPLHLITLNREAEIKCASELTTIAERESCFPAYLQEDRVIDKHIAKYPSFKGNYKKIYQYKYGLTEALYNKFKQKFAETNPHTDENRAVKKLLGEWLCSFQEVKMIDVARRAAELRGGVLIYRDIKGRFSLTPPIDSINRNTAKMTEEIRTPVKQKQKLRTVRTKSTTIVPVLDDNRVSQILDSIGKSDSTEDVESASVLHEGNQGMSLPLSLMLNALKNQRYRALKKFVTLPAFQEAINETFQTDRLIGATLVHLAASLDDVQALQILAGCQNCHLSATTEENGNVKKESFEYFEELTAFHLAIMRGCNRAALFLSEHERNDASAVCSRVDNKHLFNHENFQEPEGEGEDEEDEDFLGAANLDGSVFAIRRYGAISALDLAKAHHNDELTKALRRQAPRPT
jgi:hypothetical protein